MDLHITVVSVDLARQKGLQLSLFRPAHGGFQSAFNLGEQGDIAFCVSHLPELDGIACLALKRPDIIHRRFKLIALTHHGLRPRGISPEIRSLGQRVQFIQTFFGDAPVKDASSAVLRTA